MKKLDFIGQFRAFIKLSPGRLDMKEQAVYVRLLGIWNELRRPEWFAVSTTQLMQEVGIKKRKLVVDVKNRLVEKGFILTRNTSHTSTTQFKIVDMSASYRGEQVTSYHREQVASQLVTIGNKTSYHREQALVTIGNTSQRDTKNKDYIAAAATRACAREGDQNLSEVVQTFSNNIHPVTGEIELGKLTSFLDDFGKDWTLAAITEAAENNGRSVRYIEAILERWKRDGFQSERRGEHGGARKHSAGTAGHSGEGEKVRRRAEELAKFRAEYNAKIERERKAREAARSAESH